MDGPMVYHIGKKDGAQGENKDSGDITSRALAP